MKKICLLLIIFAAAVSPGYALTLGQIDTFEDGTTQGWGVGNPAHPLPPINIASSGPAGDDDNYLLLRAISASAGPGSKLSVFNLDQWAGDYSAEGVGRIAMDVNNLGPDDLFLRVLVADPQGGPPNNIAFSADPIFVPAGSGWTHVEFSVEAADLIAALGSAADALSAATELRLYHNFVDAPPVPGTDSPQPVTAELGVDNIEALAAAPSVPDAGPTQWMLAGAVSLLILARCRVERAIPERRRTRLLQ
jgi:hypothetical protein